MAQVKVIYNLNQKIHNLEYYTFEEDVSEKNQNGAKNTAKTSD